MGKELTKIEEKFHEQTVCPICYNRFSDSRDAERHIHDFHPTDPLLVRGDRVAFKGFGKFYDDKIFTISDINYEKRYKDYTLTLKVAE